MSKIFRLEAEFYTAKSFVSERSFVGSKIIDFSQYGTSDELNDEGVGYPVLRLNEFDGHFISAPSKYCRLLNAETYQALKLVKNDVLICRTNGNPKLVGKAAVVPKDYDYAYASYLFKIRPKRELINSATLVAFLNSKYGRMEIEKFSMASNQVNFSPAKFREMRIPELGLSLNSGIEKMTFSAFDSLEVSKDLYKQAETLLLETLGLTNFKPSTEAVNIKSFKDSFGTMGRLDAEYYQPKYDDWAHAVNGYKHGSLNVAVACEVKDKNFTPENNKIYSYIELSDIDKAGSIAGVTVAVGAELPTRARRIVKQGDVLVSSIEGSLSSCALVSEKHNDALCSTGFYVLRSNKINPETLLVLMKSAPIQALLKQGCSGTILTAINNDAFLNIPIPLIDIQTQQKIATQIQESFALKAESERFLEVAKRAVEIAIELDEVAGLEFIEQQIK